MIKNTYLRHAVAATFFLASGASNVAFAVNEIESKDPAQRNDLIHNAQRLIVDQNGKVEVFGQIGVTALTDGAVVDIDFFSFEAQKGDVLMVDIDQGMKPKTPTARSVDTTIAIYGPLPNLRIQRLSLNMDPRLPRDEGSDDIRDALIPDFVADASGVYVVGISSHPRTLTDNGGTTSNIVTGSSAPFPNGSYVLRISGVTPPVLVQYINIEIKPGSGEYAPVNPKAQGNVPVALLSRSADLARGVAAFDALKVKPESLTFGGLGDEKSWLRCAKDGMDINADGLLDLVCHFDNAKADFHAENVEGTVKGVSVDGVQFQGSAPLKIVPKIR